MDTAQKNNLQYFKTALELDNLPTVTYSDEDGKFWRLPSNRVKSVCDGKLSAKLTGELFAAYCDKYHIPEEKRAHIDSIEVVLSLFAAKVKKVVFGLLNMACTLSKSGELATDKQPWIPYDLLESDYTERTDMAVGTLSDFWNIRYKQAENFKLRVKTWSDHIAYARVLNGDQGAQSNESDEARDAADAENTREKPAISQVYIKPEKYVFANQDIVDLYKKLLDEDNPCALLQNMLSPKETHQDIAEVDAGGKMLTNMLKTHGGMSKTEPLADAQRFAMHAYKGMGIGDVLAVSSASKPDTAILIADVVADLMISHVFEKKSAPLIVTTSCDVQGVEHVIDSLTCDASQERGLLDVRWLPAGPQQVEADALRTAEKSQGEDGSHVQPQTDQSQTDQTQADQSQTDQAQESPTQFFDELQSFAVYCSEGNDPAQQRQFELTENIRKEGAYTYFSSREYVNLAVQAVELFAGALFGENTTDLQFIQMQLYEWLVVLDQTRQSLIQTAYDFRNEFPDFVGKTAENGADPSDGFREQLTQANENCSTVQKQLTYWCQADESRETKGVLRKKAVVPDEDFIAEYKNAGDTFDDSVKTVEDIKDYYRDIIEKQKGIAKKTQDSLDKYAQKQSKYDESLQLVKSCLEDVTGGNEMGARIDAFSKETDFWDEDFLVKLDRLCDTTLRYAQFWLAVHYYECQWLMDCTTSGSIIERSLRRQRSEHNQSVYWSQITSLAPCFAITPQQLPQYFTLYKKGKQVPDLQRIDLLIVDEADRINTPVALALFALAQKALVVGNIENSPDRWPFPPQFDEEIAEDAGIHDNWQKRGENGLTSSAPSSLLRAAFGAGVWN